VRFIDRPAPPNVLAGSPEEMRAELRAYEKLGVDEIAFSFGETDAERARNAIERFNREVLSALP
jgi:2-iminoacetate synthase ThiH